jgi:23S rRNA pseudouridine2605 synthase
MSTNNFKPGAGKFAAGNKFKGRPSAGGDSSSNRSSRDARPDREPRSFSGDRPREGNTGKFAGDAKKVFNRSERFTRTGEEGSPRPAGERSNSFERSSFKSGPKFSKPSPYQGGRRAEDAGQSKDRGGYDRNPADRGERKSYGDKPYQKSYGDKPAYDKPRGERKPYGDKPYGDKPYQKSFGGDDRRSDKPAYDKPRGDRKPYGEKSYGDKPYQKSFGDKPAYDKPRSERKPYGDKPAGERKSYGDKPAYDKPQGERKSYGDKPQGERKSYSDKPYGDKPQGERKSYGDKPYQKSFGGDDRRSDKPAYDKPRFDKPREEGSDSARDNKEEGAARPFKAARYESNDPSRPSGDRKPFARANPREERGDRDEKRPSRSRSEEPAEAPSYDLKRYQARERRQAEEKDDNGLIRLNRYIANAGICSRREADTLIAAGEIKVNGEIVTEMGYTVRPEDTVTYGKKRLNREKMVYVLLNKPKDFITTTEDPEGRKTVMDLVGKASKERIFPVGRLDRNTTGLLLFTNDGELAHKLTHPSNNISKIYQVELDKPITRDHFEQVTNGLELEDGKAEVDDLAIIGDSNTFLGIQIHIGKNRIVRRIFEHLGYDVVSLDRVQYAGLTKKDLSRGNWRFLNEKEVIRLKYFL